MDICRIIAKIPMLPEKGCGLVVVFLAGHDIERYPCTRLFHHIHQVVDQALKNIQRFCDADVKHSLRLVKAKACSLTAGKQDGAHFLGTESFQTERFELIVTRFDFRELHGAQRFDLFFVLFAFGRGLCGRADQIPVDGADLFQQRLLALRSQFSVIFQQMQLVLFG